MSIQLGYSAQLAFSITENTTTTPIFRTSPFTLPTWLQLALLSTACIASMLFMSSNIFKKQKTVTSRYTWEHALFAILGASTSAACGILTVFNYILHGHSGIILTTFSTIIWITVTTLRLLYLALPSHRSTLHGVANVFSLATFFSVIVPEYLFPLILVGYPSQNYSNISSSLLISSIATAIIVPVFTPYHSKLLEDASSIHPRDFSAPITRWWTYSWITPFVTKAYSLKANLTVHDLPPLTQHSKPSRWTAAFEALRLDGLNTRSALFKIFYPRMAFMALIMVFCGLSEFLGAVGLRNLLLHLESHSAAATFTPWFSACLFGISPVIRGLFMQSFEFFSTDAICHLKGITLSAIYEQVLSSAPGRKSDTGQITTLVSADIDKISTLRYTIMATFMVPVEVLVAGVILYQSLGWSCLPGLLFLLVTRAPISFYSSRFQGIAQNRVMLSIDARVRRVNDTIRGLQSIKMFGRGSSFAAWIGEKRKVELQSIWRKWIVVVLSDSVSNLAVLISLIMSLGCYTLVAKLPLQPSVIFTVLSVFNTLQKMLSLAVIGASTYAQSMVSLNRLTTFLDQTRAEKAEVVDMPLVNTSSRSDKIGCTGATAHVHNDMGDAISVVTNATVEILRGKVNLIIGKTGAGKSSLIKALMNELPLSSGSVSLRSCASESIAYASQSPFLHRGTIRDNIIFTSPFSLERYDSVLKATALEMDLKTFPDGDLSDVGESGSFLSGGQRARVALARAIYAVSKIVILDDIMSALDANTASFILQNGIKGPLMEGRTVILVSENANCRAVADQVIELKHGEVKTICKGASSDADNTSELPSIMVTQHQLSGSDSSTLNEELGPISPLVENLDSSDHEVKEPSESHSGSEAILNNRIGHLAMLRYLRLFGNLPTLFSLCLIILAAQGLDIASSLWLTFWSSNESIAPSSNLTNLFVYTGINLAGILSATFGSILLFRGAVRAGETLNLGMVTSVLGSTFSFITSTPAGQLMNRFSSDMFSLDNVLPELLKQVVENYLSIAFRVAAISSALPLFLVPAMIFLGLGIITGQVYLYGSTASKRLYAANLSPILSSICDGITGIEVIRAYGVQDSLRKKFMNSLEMYLRGWEAVSATQRWLAVRMDFFAGMISFSTAALSMVLSKDNPAKVGFSMTSSSALCTALLYAVYLASVLEVEMNSFQRVGQYINDIPQEKVRLSEEQSTPSHWPSAGNLQVSNLTAGYSLDGEPVLENISLSVEPGKRIAIVGRSGSGKSSLVASILRLAVKHRGNVFIDGLDVEDVSVERLRQAISFIPQDPTLFEGTLRFNLDFTGTIPDEILEATIKQVVGKGQETQRSWSLDRLISTNGSNLSQGERQLVAMARALANDTRIVIIDEATANLDPESDDRIQQLMREQFPHKALIAIAHRLNTILDFDEVLVLDMGQVVERGCPKTLVQSKEGRFWDMWRASAGRCGEDVEGRS